jgi:hypothetical protein
MFWGCDPACRFFVPSWRHTLGRGLRAVGRGARDLALLPFTVLGWLLNWYRQLPAVTQVALLLLILLLVGFLKWEQVLDILDRLRSR